MKLHVSGIFAAHHQEFSTVHSAVVSFMQVLMTATKQSQDVLGSDHQIHHILVIHFLEIHFNGNHFFTPQPTPVPSRRSPLLPP